MAEIAGYRRTWIDHTSEVEAPLAAVMTLLADLDQWSVWTPGLSAVERDHRKPVQVGTRFVMRVKPAPFHPPLPLRCKIYRLEPALIEWGGDVLASSVRHRFELSELSATRTRVHQVEYATNVLAFIARIAEPGILKYDLRWQNALGTRLAA